MTTHSLAFLMFLIPLFILAMSETETLGIQYCDKETTYYRGKCVDQKCSDNCRVFESAERGYCRQGEVKLICICTYDCAKMKPRAPPPPKKDKSPPPPPPSPTKDATPPPPPPPTNHDKSWTQDRSNE